MESGFNYTIKVPATGKCKEANEGTRQMDIGEQLELSKEIALE